ncbi:MAG: hypothetical protein SFH39_00255 [Candidatus Magnetobacterium sp. LHC-1]
MGDIIGLLFWMILKILKLAGILIAFLFLSILWNSTGIYYILNQMDLKYWWFQVGIKWLKNFNPNMQAGISNSIMYMAIGAAGLGLGMLLGKFKKSGGGATQKVA